MLSATNTPNNAGVTIHGDYSDLNELYEALHAVLGEEGEYAHYEAARSRVLDICDDLRHALMGSRDFEFVDNGMNTETMKNRAVITPKQNVYFAFSTLWPDVLFSQMALNQFIGFYAKRCRLAQWNTDIVAVRKLQAAIAVCLQKTLTDASYRRTMNIMVCDTICFENYVPQYIDLLNVRFLALDKEKRAKKISTMAKRIAQQDDHYRAMADEVRMAAKAYHCEVGDIEIKGIEYPEKIVW